MSRSTKQFNRWLQHDKSTWSAQVYRKFNDELYSILEAQDNSVGYTYAQLKNNEAEWADEPTKYFVKRRPTAGRFANIEAWSDSFNQFNDWVTLNAILTIASNFENYLASVVALALESDPGAMLGESKSIDGAQHLKRLNTGILHKLDCITPCVMGDWSARIDAFESLFGQCPGFRGGHSEFEEIRRIRNRVGHAFGREIEETRLHGKLTAPPMEKVTRQRAYNLSRVVQNAIRAIDLHLLQNHIGDYEAVRFYSRLYPTLHKHVNTGQRAIYLKKAIGNYGAVPRGKIYCNGLVEYWESL